MSVENVALIRQLCGWVAAGEGERAFALYDPEIEWDSGGAPWLQELGFDRVYRGHDEVRGALRAWFEAWKTIEYRPEELIGAGDEVLALVRIKARSSRRTRSSPPKRRYWPRQCRGGMSRGEGGLMIHCSKEETRLFSPSPVGDRSRCADSR
jgi:ketosteroid isomerase-like protein